MSAFNASRATRSRFERTRAARAHKKREPSPIYEAKAVAKRARRRERNQRTESWPT